MLLYFHNLLLAVEVLTLLVCDRCLYAGICRGPCTPLVRRAELQNPAFLFDLRRTGYLLDLTPSEWLEFPHDVYKNYTGCIVDQHGNHVTLNLEVLDLDGIHAWFRDNFTKVRAENNSGGVSDKYASAYVTVGTLLKIACPVEALMWGIRDDDQVA